MPEPIARPEPAASPPGGRALKAPLLSWLGLSLLVTAPYVLAELRPPPGREFLGAFYYPDDFCQYLSFAEQASRGRFLFVNKFDARPQTGALVNLEWWLAGAMSIPLGGRLTLAWHALRVLSVLGLVFAFWRALAMGGLRGKALVWGLLLVVTGGGMGWLRLLLGQSGGQVPDIVAGIYPWHQMLFNTHFVFGAALLWWSLLLFLDHRRRGGHGLAWTACACALGLSRPYDLAAFGVMAATDVLAHPRASRGGTLCDLLSLARLAPVLAYYLWLFRGSSFGGWGAQSAELPFRALEVLWAVLPAALLVALGLRSGTAGPAELPLARLCAVWGVVLVALVTLSPAPIVKQLATSLGASVLLWAALRCPPGVLPIAALVLSPTSLFLLWRAFHPAPQAFVHEDYAAAADALRASCRPGDVAIAPTDLSLLLAARTPCSVALGHRLLTPRLSAEVADGNRFYAAETSPQWRLDYLARKDASIVLLPAGQGAWLGSSTRYRQMLRLPILEVWQRD